MDTAEYSVGVFSSHVERAGFGKRLHGATVLELGPGDSIASAVIAAAYGARAILVDSDQFVRTDVAPYLELERVLRRSGCQPPRLDGCSDYRQILTICNARYMTDGLTSLRQVESGSVDFIFSQATLEHVRKSEFLETLRECRRILRAGGVCSNQIDLRDHLGGALNNRRFGEKIWESDIFATSGFYTNRISCGEMTNLFRQAGFGVEISDVRRWEKLPTAKNRLAKEFRTLPDEELCISGFAVVLR